MTTVNYECYVSPEVAKLLREAGFDWECRKIYYRYHEDGDTWELEDNYKNYKSILKLDHCLLTPTLDVAQRWLREVKNIEIYISWEIEFEEKELNWNKRRYCYDIDTHVNSIPLLSIDDDYWAEGYHTFGNSYSTYEEAQEAGIKKALELILEKGK